MIRNRRNLVQRRQTLEMIRFCWHVTLNFDLRELFYYLYTTVIRPIFTVRLHVMQRAVLLS